ncbi:uncharacterized protein LOC116412852 [Galleria mellonella]|uniref:Uncharacterized protein LOC116412852 n=1 Tax=Galleria mellonella TaxID=7137 RepID=A0A6J3BXC5_GALME|nr:uncharacterized protein LOC116412852 [Galleria mellonella]
MALYEIYFSLVLLSKCIGIDLDYYIDGDTYNNDTNMEQIERRYDGSSILAENVAFTKAAALATNAMLFNEYQEDDEFKIYLKLKKNVKITLNSTLNISNHSIPVKTLGTPDKLPKVSITMMSLSPFDVINNYQYDYSDDDTQLELPREDNVQRSVNISVNISKTNDSQNNTNQKIYYADFFNLKSAAETVNYNHKTSESNTWYVPEKYPCWELPVLYGKLRRKSNASDVFHLYAGKLRNVIDDEKQESSLSKSYGQPPFQTFYNKWCTVKPCYGDHTLCLFPHKTISKLCDAGYKVEKPTTIQQIAFVNTLNSMRNSVANGASQEYPHFPSAANMKQIIYDLDLERISEAWLRQCLPGPAPCSALNGNYITSLECTKSAEHCCIHSDATSKCIPRNECLVSPILGCIYIWFLSAGSKFNETDIKCGHTSPVTFNTAQLIWANTNKIGCAYGIRTNGDIRVVCNFAPGAPFFLNTKYYCGFIAHNDISTKIQLKDLNVTDQKYISFLGLQLDPPEHEIIYDKMKQNFNYSNISNNDYSKFWSLHDLNKKYNQTQMRKNAIGYTNGTIGIIAKLVTKYTFFDESQSRCDTGEPIYIVGRPGSLCIEKSRRFHALCYDFRDPTPGYRLVAVIAPIALFSLILYDLFSGVVRQTNY